MYKNEKTKSSSFCMAPWVHSAIRPSGERLLCTISEPPKNLRSSLNQHWNSNFMKRVRSDMLADKEIPECRACSTFNPYRNHFNHHFNHLKQHALSNTSTDGFYKKLPVSVDFRLTNLCNFKCLMCVPDCSSAWESEFAALFGKQSLPNWLNEDKKYTQKFQTDVVENEFLDLVHQGELEEIYWAGGEPLINPVHWKIMSKIIESGQSEKISVRYTTNLSSLKFKNHTFQSILEKFKKFQIGVSLDGTHQIGEYLRWGLNFEKIERHIKELLPYIDQNNHKSIFIEHRLTLPGIFSLVDLVRFANDHEIKIHSRLVDTFIDTKYISPLSPLCLPNEILHPILIEELKKAKAIDVGYCESLFQLIEKVLTLPRLGEDFSDSVYSKALKNGLESLMQHETRRPNQIGFMEIIKKSETLTQFFETVIK